MERYFEKAPFFCSLGPLCGRGGERHVILGRSLVGGETFLWFVSSFVSLVFPQKSLCCCLLTFSCDLGAFVPIPLGFIALFPIGKRWT